MVEKLLMEGRPSGPKRASRDLGRTNGVMLAWQSKLEASFRRTPDGVFVDDRHWLSMRRCSPRQA